MRRILGSILTSVLVAAVLVPGPAAAVLEPAGGQADAFDLRDAAPGLGPTRAQGDAILALAREIPTVKLGWNTRFGTPRSILRYDGTLTETVAGSAEEAARAWLDAHAALFGWSNSKNLRTVRTLAQPNGGPVAVLFHQRFGALEGSSLGGSVMVGLDRDNRIVSVRANVVRIPRLADVPAMSAAAAVEAVAGKALAANGTQAGWSRFRNGRLPMYARKVAFPSGRAAARPAWEVLHIKGPAEGYRTVVDAQTGVPLYRTPLVASEAPEGRVFRNYPGAKHGGAHELVSFVGDPDASPAGWLSPAAREAAGPITLGNNASTATAWIDPFASDGTGELRGVGPGGVFDYEFTDAWHTSNCGSNPISDETGTVDTPTYILDALPATVNLFYHHNVMHDFFYKLGFNEAAGNMQINNFGKGGLGGDPVIGNVQAGALAGDVPGAELGRDNANMLTLPDGIPPITNMYVWEPIPGAIDAPCVDGDFDAAVIYHEFTHAVSNRWVGGEWGNLNGLQGGSMGESWSDFYAMHYLRSQGLELSGAMGAYATGDPVRGIRNFAFGDNPLGYGDVGYDLGGAEVHSDGEIWNAVLWDIRTELDKARPAGADLAAQLIADAMPISGTDPTMLDMRDAILAADRTRTKGANQTLLWKVFAGRGMGVSASTTGVDDADPVPAFDSAIKAQNATVTIQVVDRASGAPVPGAKVFLGEFEIGVASLGRTATDGRIRLTLADNTYPVKIATNGYGSRVVPVAAKAGKASTEVIEIGINYASGGAGAKVVSSSAEAVLGAASLAIDDREATTWRPDADEAGPAGKSFVIDLAGSAPVTIDEVTLSARPLGGSGRYPTLRDWKLEVSLDGTTFTPLGKGGFRGHFLRPLASTLGYRTWKVKPARASFLRLTVESAQDDIQRRIQLAELQVFGTGPAVAVPPPAGALETHHAEGTVLVASADSQLTRNLIMRHEETIPVVDTTVTAPTPCILPPPTQGIDAYVFELPEGFGDGTHTFKIQFVPLAADPRGDPDIYFYTDDCQEIGSVASAPEFDNPPEVGLIPQATKWILAQHYTTVAGTMVLDASSERIAIPKAAAQPKPAVKGVRSTRTLPATGIGGGLAGGLSVLAGATGLAAWLRPRRRVAR